MTLGELKTQVLGWMRESVEDALLTESINDGIEDLWMSVILFQLGQFFGGPITNLQFASGSERGTITSIDDPTVAPVAVGVAGGALAAATLRFQYSYVTESGSETNPSPLTSLNRLINNLAQVTAPAFAAGAFGWNIYAADAAGRLALQNPAPLPFGFPWTEPESGVTDIPGAPSLPTCNNTADNLFYIRHIEVRTPDGTYKSWNQSDIDSQMMRKAAGTQAGNSTAQDYFYDLVRSTTQGLSLEIRPAAGATLNPRYFYISKPRRFRFDQSQIPFQNLAATMYLRCFAISLLKLASDEYEASQQWASKAEAQKSSILRSIDQMNKPKDTRVVPYMY